MNVRNLIAVLSEQNPDAEVCVRLAEFGYGGDISYPLDIVEIPRPQPVFHSYGEDGERLFRESFSLNLSASRTLCQEPSEEHIANS